MDLEHDEITIIIAGVMMKVKRSYSLPVPHEITAVIPRAELRRWRYQDGQLIEASETILNSITITHSPHHQSERRVPAAAGGQPPTPGQTPVFPPQASISAGTAHQEVLPGDPPSRPQPAGFGVSELPSAVNRSPRRHPAPPAYPSPREVSPPSSDTGGNAGRSDLPVTDQTEKSTSDQKSGYRITWRPPSN